MIILGSCLFFTMSGLIVSQADIGDYVGYGYSWQYSGVPQSAISALFFAAPSIALGFAVFNLILWFGPWGWALHPIYTLCIHLVLGLGWTAETILLAAITQQFALDHYAFDPVIAYSIVNLVVCGALFWCSVAYFGFSIAALLAHLKATVTSQEHLTHQLTSVTTPINETGDMADVPAPTYEPRPSQPLRYESSSFSGDKEETSVRSKAAFERVDMQVDEDLEMMRKK